tara:strand:+ start:376 stop:897 length:522 start_codon:yes stop_codon:yes gene_type:complete
MIKDYIFDKLTKKDLSKILDIRNQAGTRSASINNKVILKDDHEQWFRKKKKDDFFHYYVLKHYNKIVGVGYGKNYELKKRSCTWGIYTDLNIKSKNRYGSTIKYLLFENLFSTEEVDKIECQVMEGFEWIKDWYIRWGHELIDFDKNLNCYNLTLEKKNWNKIKSKIYEKNFK